MDNKPLVTLCIPTYNCSSVVADTVHSIQEQTYSNIKVKIFDNQSTDTTFDLLKKVADQDSRINIERNEQNLGGEGNFTKCIQAAEGKYTGVFHADDIYDKKMVERAVEELERHPEAIAVCVHAATIDGKGQSLGERFLPPELKIQEKSLLAFEQLFHLVLKYGNFITCPGVVVRSEAYREYIKNWNGEDYKTSADLDVWLRLSKKGKLLFINQPLIHYRISEVSYSFNLFKRRTHRHDLFLVIDKYLDEFRKSSSFSPQDELFYTFLNFKDESLISYNILRSGANQPLPNYSIGVTQLIRCFFRSKFHFKFSCLGTLIFLMRALVPRPLWRLLK